MGKFIVWAATAAAAAGGIDPGWIALIGTLCGGVGLKVLEHWLGKGRIKTDDATMIRDELRGTIAANREEIKQLESDVDMWRDRYYDLRDKYSEQHVEWHKNK